MPTHDEMREVALNQMEKHAKQLESNAEQHENRGRENMANMFRDAAAEIRRIKRLHNRG